jgi:hypothetical protein
MAGHQIRRFEIGAEKGGDDMSRYERSQYFERLCALRMAYETRGVADRFATVSIEDVIQLAERELATVVVAAEDAEAVAAKDELN